MPEDPPPSSLPDPGTVQLSEEFEAAHSDMPIAPPKSGDFHAVFALPDGSGKVAVVLGDVQGHGPEPNVQAARLKEVISACLAEGLPPAETLNVVNAAAEKDPKSTRLATVFAAVVEPDTGHIAYASGGHEPALVVTPEDASPEPDVQELDNTGPAVGVLGEKEVRYTEAEATLSPGGTLLLYTDGVTEARRETERGRSFLGVERLRLWIARFGLLPPVQLVGKLLGRVRAFAGGKGLRDDVTLLALRRREPPAK